MHISFVWVEALCLSQQFFSHVWTFSWVEAVLRPCFFNTWFTDFFIKNFRSEEGKKKIISKKYFFI